MSDRLHRNFAENHSGIILILSLEFLTKILICLVHYNGQLVKRLVKNALAVEIDRYPQTATNLLSLLYNACCFI